MQRRQPTAFDLLETWQRLKLLCRYFLLAITNQNRRPHRRVMPNRKHHAARRQINALHAGRARLAHRGDVTTIKRNCKRQRRVVIYFDDNRATQISDTVNPLHRVTTRHFYSRLNHGHTRYLALTHGRLTRRSIPTIVCGNKPTQTLLAIHKNIAPCVHTSKPRPATHTNCTHQ